MKETNDDDINEEHVNQIKKYQTFKDEDVPWCLATSMLIKQTIFQLFLYLFSVKTKATFLPLHLCFCYKFHLRNFFKHDMCACVCVGDKNSCIFEFINIYSKDVRLNRQFSIYMQSILSFQVNIDFLLPLYFSTWLVAVCKEWKSLSGCESAVDVMTFWAWNGSWLFKDLCFLGRG